MNQTEGCFTVYAAENETGEVSGEMAENEPVSDEAFEEQPSEENSDIVVVIDPSLS